jgi:hypothetical protein
MLPELKQSKSAGCGCCEPKRLQHPQSRSRGVWEIATGSLSVAVWILMPKCPVCLAAHVAFWTGLGLSFTAAKYARYSLMALSCVALLYVGARRLVSRNARPLTQTARQAD